MNIRRLADMLKISKSTVSMALRDDPRIAVTTRQRVKGAARKHKYIPNPKVAMVMSAMGRKKTDQINAPIALLSSFPIRMAWASSQYGLDRFHRGASKRATELGYKVEEFWLGDPTMTPRRMEQILEARGTEGVLVFSYPQAPATLTLDLSPYASAVIGRALLSPSLLAVDADHHQSLFLALDEARKRGYKRIGLVLDTSAHERTMHCWAAAYQFAATAGVKPATIPIFFDDNAGSLQELRKWEAKYRPDAILADTSYTYERLLQAGVRIPDKVGAAILFWRNPGQKCAGVDLLDEIVAARAVELVVEQLRNNQRGIPAAHETILISGFWRDGASMPDRNIP